SWRLGKQAAAIERFNCSSMQHIVPLSKKRLANPTDDHPVKAPLIQYRRSIGTIPDLPSPQTDRAQLVTGVFALASTRIGQSCFVQSVLVGMRGLEVDDRNIVGQTPDSGDQSLFGWAAEEEAERCSLKEK
ncbi:4648_t:CDS:2, partial [Acaulospora colombiana]